MVPRPCASCCSPPPFPACTTRPNRPIWSAARLHSVEYFGWFSPAGTYVSEELIAKRNHEATPSQIFRGILASVTA